MTVAAEHVQPDTAPATMGFSPDAQRRDQLRLDVSEAALASGFSNSMAGTHTSKTMMLRELRALLSAVPGQERYEAYATAVLSDNVLDKATASTRTKTLLHLRHLYALQGAVLVFAALRELWPRDNEAQPLIALMSAIARDPLLRSTAGFMLATAEGARVTPEILGSEVARAYPDRYTDGVIHHIGQNTGSSWNQAGFLHGKQRKYRTRPKPTEIATVYALYLGHLEGFAGPALFDTLWIRLLEVDDRWVRDAAESAGRAGWIDYASAGGMLDIGFQHLDDLAKNAA